MNSDSNSTLKSLLYFDSMVTPKIVTFIYWLLILVVVGGGLISIFANFGFFSILTGLLGMAFGVVAARLWCELVIVIFKINANLQTLSDAQKQKEV